MDWTELARVLALYMILEGIMPFVAPARWRRAVLTIAGLDSRVIRMIGLFSMLAGLAALNFVK